MNFEATSLGESEYVPSFAESFIAAESLGSDHDSDFSDQKELSEDAKWDRSFAPVEIMILGIDLQVDADEPVRGEKEILSRAVRRGLRRIVRPIPGLTVRAEGDSVGVVVEDREIDLGPEIQQWFLNALRSGDRETGIFEVMLPMSWLRPAVATGVFSEA